MDKKKLFEEIKKFGKWIFEKNYTAHDIKVEDYQNDD